MAGAPIEFYFDFNSPYGYIAAHKIDALAAKYGRTVDWRPVLLGAIFKVTGGAPLPDLPLKGEYSKRDFARSARFHGVTINMPAKFPFSPVAASRAVWWAKGQDEAKAHALALALFQAALRDGKDIAGPDAVADIAAANGFDRAAVLAGLNDGAVKQKLIDAVEAAIKAGVFGSPYVVVDGEPFWGMDRFDQLERWLATGGF